MIQCIDPFSLNCHIGSRVHAFEISVQVGQEVFLPCIGDAFAVKYVNEVCTGTVSDVDGESHPPTLGPGERDVVGLTGDVADGDIGMLTQCVEGVDECLVKRRHS